MSSPDISTPKPCAGPASGRLLAGRPLAEKAEALVRAFQRQYGRPAHWLAAAPGRINLIGEHVDYNDGLVLPMAIDRHVLMAAAPAPGDHVTVRSAAAPEPAIIPIDTPLQPGSPTWANYVRGVLEGCRTRQLPAPAMDLWIDSDLPLGGGLSSSAALEVATATLLETIHGRQLDPVQKALLCLEAEHRFAHVPCGIMDQFAVTLGREDHLLLLDCRSRRFRWVPLHAPELTMLVINTHVRHELNSGEYATRRRQCEEAARLLGVASLRDATAEMLSAHAASLDPLLYRRARHVISEIQRTAQTAIAIEQDNWPQVGQLMHASHASLRDDFDVSCAELDLIVDIARSLGPEHGIVGCRMTGGGFGGCCVALVRTNALPDITTVLLSRYQQQTGLLPTLFASRPAGGAKTLLPSPPPPPGS